MHAFFSH